MSASTAADVFKDGVLAGRLTRTGTGIEFRYYDSYPRDAPAIASTLPVTTDPVVTAAGAVPAYFAGLLPEGRRLTALRRSVKTSSDDELSLLLAVGRDTIGDVQVVSTGTSPPVSAGAVTIDRSFEEITFADLLTENGIGATPALSGVQDKVSAAMISMPVSRRNERYILKLNPPENPFLVQNEAFFAELARRNRMPVADSRLVYDRDREAGLLVTRFDREWDGQRMRMLGVEDACQALGLWPAEKYNVSMEDAASALLNLTPARAVAAQQILRQVVFAWLTGNGDLHTKNLAVLDAPQTGQRISPAYDVPSTMFYGDATLALEIGGRDSLSAVRLRAFARFLELPEKAAERAVGQAIAATQDIGDAIAAADLGFDQRVVNKTSRQLAIRHRDIAKAL